MRQGKIKEIGLFLIIIIVYVLIMSICGIGCPIRFVTGIPCPGCGATRAVVELVRGNVIGSLRYHPLIFVFPILVYLLCKEVLGTEKPYEKIILIVIASLFIITYVVRLILGDEIVHMNIQESLLYKIYFFLRKGEMLW